MPRHPSELLSEISALALSNGLAATGEEAVSIALCIVDGMQLSDNDQKIVCVELFQEYFSVSEFEANQILAPLFGDIESVPKDSGSLKGNQNCVAIIDEDFDEPLVEEEMVGEDECELCERYIKLTRHHLIPRSTWKRIGPQLANAANAFEKGDVEQAHRILGEGFIHLESELTNGLHKKSIKCLMQRTCNICRNCHSAIHSTYDNMILATKYNTVEKLISDDSIYNFCKWASKQRAGKYAR